MFYCESHCTVAKEAPLLPWGLSGGRTDGGVIRLWSSDLIE